MERLLTSFLVAMAAVGLVLSAAVHFSTYAGINPQKIFPGIWILHVLIFVIWLPAVIYARKAGDVSNDFLRTAAPYAPGWMKILSSILFAYALVNFGLFMYLMEGGSPSIEKDGRKVLQSHGNLIREITDEEYGKFESYEVRGFSGHWMVFYSVGMTLIYSRHKSLSSEIDDNEVIEETQTAGL